MLPYIDHLSNERPREHNDLVWCVGVRPRLGKRMNYRCSVSRRKTCQPSTFAWKSLVNNGVFARVGQHDGPNVV